MTTASWSLTWSSTTDAGFRAWGQDLSTHFSTVGLVQTTDTGQINWATVTRSSINTAAGYEIWRFSDALQSTAPVFVKIGYGTSAAGGQPGVFVSCGSGTDGAGNLTGVFTSQRECTTSGVIATSGTHTSYLCYKDGFLGLILFNASNGSSPTAAFAISRTCDGSGAWTGTGAVQYARQFASSSTPGEPIVQALRFATTADTYTAATGGFCLAAHNTTATLSGDNPVFLHWMIAPEMVPVLGLCSHVAAHYTLGTITATLIGSTPRTYFTTGNATAGLGNGAANSNGTSYAIAMLWE